MNKTVKSIIIALVYALFTLFLVLHHEIWRDEAQVWLLVKYSNLPQLFERLINEGHPPLFYLINMLFQKIGLSILSMQLFCWLSSVLGVFLLFRYSPFKWWVNLSIVLSAGFIYDFPVIARSYSLLPFLVFSAAALYSKAKEHPILYALILFALSQLHSIMLGFVSVLIAVFLFDVIKNKYFSKGAVLGLLISSFGVLLTVFRSFLSVQSNYFLDMPTAKGVLYQTFSVLYQFFTTPISSSLSRGYLSILAVYFIIFLVLYVLLFKLSKKTFLIALAGVLYQFYVYIHYYADVLFVNRVFCAYLVMIFGFWLAFRESDNQKLILKTSVTLSLFFLMTTLNGLNMCRMEVLYNYSAAKPAAEYIVQNIDKNSVILSDTFPMTETVFLYLPEGYDIIDVNNDRPTTFVVWTNKILKRLTPEDWDNYILSHNNFDGRKIYIIQSKPQAKVFGEVKYVSPSSVVRFEDYIIWEYENDKH
ncbi:hypothetical protein IKQ26_09405 [bacterium]|nr:hypothetical protein [bacterium]